jgi:HAE1 family hydrophobic/amphiphilic exporter-1
VIGSLVGSYFLMPPSDYLPSGNRNLIFGFVITEPGLSNEEFLAMAYHMEDYLEPYWSVEAGTPEAEALPPVQMQVGEGFVEVQPAPIENFFFVSYQNGCFMGATSQDDLNVKPLAALMTQGMMTSPKAIGAIPIFFQASLFGGVRSTGSVDVEVRSDDLTKVKQVAGQLFGALAAAGLTEIQPDPATFDLDRPEIQAVPDRVRAADVGLNVADVGFILAAGVDGAYVGDYYDKGDAIDLEVKFRNADGTPVRDIHNVPIYTPSGQIVPLSSVVQFVEVGAPQQINRIEEMPGVQLRVRLAQGMAVDTAVGTIRGIVKQMRESGAIGPDVIVSLAGNADKLDQTRTAMFGNWTGFNGESILALVQSRGFLALLVVYLLMSALFESFIHPLAILLTVPLAMVGGFGGLKLVHLLSLMNPISPIQQLDVVTMLGFVILLGIVVNNAILIVHQTLNNLDMGMSADDALRTSVRTRIRPIFMTAFTSIGGMLPLALMTGAGSELYRGLAAVMVGGLLVSTLFTLILVPVVYSMFLHLRIGLMQWLGREDQLPAGAGHAGGRHPGGVPGTATADPTPMSASPES